MDAKQRFSDRVEFYHRFRPSYPVAVIELIQEQTNLSDASTIADIGSGTGFSSK